MATTDELADRIPEYLFVRYGTAYTSLQWNELPERDREFWRSESKMLVRRVLRNEAVKESR